TNGEVLRTFGEIEQCARNLLAKIELFCEGDVLGVQIGNHEDWPGIFLGCLRKHLVVLPLEQSISEQQRHEALKIGKATAVVFGGPGGGTPEIIRLRAAHNPPDWGERSPALLKLTSGTTAAPRVIRFRSEQLLADCGQICDTMEIADS